MTSEGKGERGIRSILYALYQSPCPISVNCETQIFDESDGSKTSMTLKDGKVTIQHQKSKKQTSSKSPNPSSPDNEDEKTEIFMNDEEESIENENLNTKNNDSNEIQENKVENEENNNENDQNNNNENDKENETENQETNPQENSFEYVTSAHGDPPQYDYLFFVNDGKIDGDCPKNLKSQLQKIYKHIYRSLLNLYDLPLTKLSLHFGVNDKGEIEEEEKNENDSQQKAENLEGEKNENDGQQKAENLEEEEKNDENSIQKVEKDDQKLNDQEKENDQERRENGQLDSQVENTVNNLLNSPKKTESEEPPHSYEIFLLEDSFCATSTQVVGPDENDDDIDGKFGEFFSEEMKIKINYERCYFDLPDCSVSNYKAPRSMCILLKAHKKFPNASCARLQDLIQTRFEKFDEEENSNDEFDRNSYSTDLNAGSNYTVDSTSFNNREYNNFTKTIIDYDLYNEQKRPSSRLSSSSRTKKSSRKDQKSKEKDSKSENSEQKTTELNNPKVFVCVRCWHLISSIDYVAFIQHQKTPTLHTLPPLPFQPVVQSELYEKRLYPMGLTSSLNKPFSFMLSVENSPYKKKVPQPRKPPPPPPTSQQFETAKRPSTTSSLSSTSRAKQDVFSRLLSKTWTTQRNDGMAGRTYAISKGCKRPKTQPIKMTVFQENPAAVNSVRKSYGKTPFDIGLINPKRKKKLHPAFGGPEDFSFRLGGPSEVSGRKAGDNRPDFVI